MPEEALALIHCRNAFLCCNDLFVVARCSDQATAQNAVLRTMNAMTAHRITRLIAGLVSGILLVLWLLYSPFIDLPREGWSAGQLGGIYGAVVGAILPLFARRWTKGNLKLEAICAAIVAPTVATFSGVWIGVAWCVLDPRGFVPGTPFWLRVLTMAFFGAVSFHFWLAMIGPPAFFACGAMMCLIDLLRTSGPSPGATSMRVCCPSRWEAAI
jgi:hypothetical protein